MLSQKDWTGLIDTGIFKDNRYFDVFVEYTKLEPEEIFIKISIWNRGDKACKLHVLPTLLFRNTWSWLDGSSKSELKKVAGRPDSVLGCHQRPPGQTAA
jgi:hypothetical protein